MLAFCIALIVLCPSCKDGDEKEVTVEKVVLRDIIEKVSANGKIQPEVDVKISSEVSGVITDIHIKEGEEVKAGDLLISIRPDLLEASVSRTAAALNNAKANHANAKARAAQAEARFVVAEKNYSRSQRLFQDNVMSQAEMDQAEADFQSVRADKLAADESVKAAYFSIKSAEASTKEANDNLGRTSIFAPTDGVITALQVEEGETVLGTIQMSGTELMRVSKLDFMEVDVEVNESDIVRVGMGDIAEVEVDAYQNRVFKGEVTEIANASTNTAQMSADQVTNFSVKIRILPESYQDLMVNGDGFKSPFRTGMSATVEVITESKDDILCVPIEAVTTRTDTASTSSFREKMERRKEERENKEDLEPLECVFVLENGDAAIRVVSTGIQDNRHIEILSGLNEGDEVITGPYALVSRELENGDEVEVKSGEDED